MAYQFGTSMTITVLACLGGIALWFLVRKKRRRVRLPILRIMSEEKRSIPRYSLIAPPWFLFICYVLLGLLLIAFSLQPALIRYLPGQSGQNKTHIFLDMSPSVLAGATPQRYFDRVLDLYKKVQREGRVTISTSHSKEIYEPASPEELALLMHKLGFHRAGIRLGNALRSQMGQVSDIDRLFVVSDYDRSSWDDFNWKFLVEQAQVFHVPLRSFSDGKLSNVYISNVRGISSIASNLLEWEVSLSRVGDTRPVSGKIMLYQGERLLQQMVFGFSDNAMDISFNVEVPYAVVSKYRDANSADLPFVWRITVDKADAISADNLFYSKMRWLKQDVLLVAEPMGERFLNDRVHHLEVTLAVAGIKPLRLDAFPQDEKNLMQYPLWILFGSDDVELDSFCPTTVNIDKNKIQHIWLVPSYLNMDYDNLCRCFVKILGKSSVLSNTEAACKHISNRNQWISVLTSLNTKQIGGEIQNSLEALAFRGTNTKSNIEITAFTLPLSPSEQTGLSYARLPIVIHSLLRYEGILTKAGDQELNEWPRVRDLSLLYDNPDFIHGKFGPNFSNVPISASRLVPISKDELPPTWDQDLPNNDTHALAGRKKSKEVASLIRIAVMIAASILFIEGLLILFSILRKGNSRDKGVASIMLLMLAIATNSKASVSIDVVGSMGGQLQLERVTREVISRTSIDYRPDVKVHPVIDDTVLLSPWLWTKTPGLLLDDNGELKAAVVSWLRRGGFLIIEGSYDNVVLDKWMRRLSKRLTKYEGWRVIPPDHELMRSFHLLDALPVCDNVHVWRGFHFDGRLAILVIPYPFLESLSDNVKKSPCSSVSFEHSVRVFINILMVALTTDYKNDQVHLPEILKRLR